MVAESVEKQPELRFQAAVVDVQVSMAFKLYPEVYGENKTFNIGLKEGIKVPNGSSLECEVNKCSHCKRS